MNADRCATIIKSMLKVRHVRANGAACDRNLGGAEVTWVYKRAKAIDLHVFDAAAVMQSCIVFAYKKKPRLASQMCLMHVEHIREAYMKHLINKFIIL